MEESFKKCYMCKRFDRFYTKGSKQYNRTKYGWCSEQTGIIDSNGEGCERFAKRPKQDRRDCMVTYYLSDILSEITEIRKVLEDEEQGDEEREAL